MAGCSSGPSVITEKVESIDLSLGTTVGNHTYLPLSFSRDYAENHVGEILQVLDIFEKSHPEFEVTSWKIEEGDSGHVHGLWIDHRPVK